MSTKRFPYVPPEVVRELAKRFPQPIPRPGDSQDEIMYRSGAASVVTFLTNQVADQTKDQLTGDP